MNEDWLLRYCIALDAGNFDALGEVLEQAQRIPGLDEAIAGMHQHFNSHESWTQQLQAIRLQLLHPDELPDTAILVHCPYCRTTHSKDTVQWCRQKYGR